MLSPKSNGRTTAVQQTADRTIMQSIRTADLSMNKNGPGTCAGCDMLHAAVVLRPTRSESILPIYPEQHSKIACFTTA
ncbi:MAG: hypothetical protein ACO1NO_11035 [Burkholderiaceae bacterium]